MTRISIASVRQQLAAALGSGRNPRSIARLVLAVLVVLNLIAAAVVLKPWEGSAGSLQDRVVSLRQELKQKQAVVERLRGIVSKVQTARGDGDTFMASYLLDRRTVSSTLLDELDQMARKAGVKQKEVTFAFEPVEGTDALTHAEITANYEGQYKDLTLFLNLLDHSPRLLIIDSLGATPQPTGGVLEVAIKLNTFVREDEVPEAAREQASSELPGRAQ
ncbi:MAG TPA: type 4a pilus biogenesis protein PilO [Bryobacteraceae bacterium]|nr:type 4a pilus biogenesis protein PilO [Bryobacteraceae bacterium]